MTRIESIVAMEEAFFRRSITKNSGTTFKFMNEFLEKRVFCKKDLAWKFEKMEEEFVECLTAVNDLKAELISKNVNEFTFEHAVEEVGDFMLASAGCIQPLDVKVIPFKDDERYARMLEHIEVIKEVIDDINSYAYMLDGVPEITVQAVFDSNKAKMEEITSAYHTYDTCLNSVDVVTNPLVKLVRRLYSQKEIKNPDMESKIIKDIRRMRFALIYGNK